MTNLRTPEMIKSLSTALHNYDKELSVNGYADLTRYTYTAAVNRFIDYLEAGKVIPEFDRRSKREHY